jgi:hypothetical protein
MINRLNEVLINKGDKFVNTLLKENLIISEKLDTFRIQFEKNNGEITFYTKDNKKIDKITRTLNDVWEDACVELPILIENANILENYRYGLYYSPVERPLRLPYTKIPKYILTDISKRNKFNKITESLQYDQIEEWAGKLCMGRPPVIFKGNLNETQIKNLIDYEIEDYTDHDNFVELIKELFGSTYSKEPIIEGIIIQTNNALSQIVSYEFDILNEAYEHVNQSRDFYDLIILSITSFMQSYGVPVLESLDSEINYINVICDIFNKYCKTDNMSESLDPKYLTPTNFGESKGTLNRIFIKNQETIELLDKAPIYEQLFKVMLSSFRKAKKPYGLLDESTVEKFNGYVYMISNLASGYSDQTMLNEALSPNIAINSVKDRQPSDIDNMRVISSIQRAFTPRELELEKGQTQCVIYLTNYLPFTQSQLDNIANMKKQWQCNIVLAAVSNKYKLPGKKFFLSDELVNAQMQTIQEFNRDNIDGFIMLDSWSLLEIFEFCRPKYEPIAVITDMSKKSELALQLFFEEEVMSKRIGVEDNFNVGEMENKDALIALRSIEDENFSSFNELVPPPVRNYYNNIINEYKLWSGAILKQ